MTDSVSLRTKNLDDWLPVELGEILQLKYGKGLKAADRMGGGIPVFGSGGVVGFHDAALVRGPGVVVGRKGNVGAAYWSEGDFYPIDTTYFVETQQDLRFIYYLLSTLTFENSHAAVPGLSREAAYAKEVLLPPLEEQRLISATLNMFDLLIENNRRRIELLEETARLLYREWFVNFRYPGHANVPLVDSELGPIPSNWEIHRVDEVIGVVGGGTPSKTEENYWTDGAIQWYTPSDLTATGSMFAFESSLKINELGLAKSSANLFPSGSVMMTSRATIGVLSFSTTEACTNQGFITCVPSEQLSGSHIYFWLESQVPLFLQLGTGTTFKELTKSTFRKLLVAVPPIPLENEFCSLVEPLLQSVLNLLQQQRVLRAGRDLLLPHLVSGDLDISDLDLSLEAVS